MKLSGIHLIILCFMHYTFVTYSQSLSINQKDIFISGQNAYHTYRIPSVIITPSGAILTFCEGRKDQRHDYGDIDLVLKRSDDNGNTWSPLTVIWDDQANTCGNPCPVIDQETGTIWLFATWNLGTDREGDIIKGTAKDTRRVYVLRSDDDGLTWSLPRDITQTVKKNYWRWFATGPGIGIQLKQGPKKGRLIIPCDHSFPESIPGLKYGAHVMYSDDHGKSWSVSDPVLPGLNENQVVELSDGSLLMNARNHRYRGSRAIAVSSDYGETWPSISYKSNLDESRCQASILSYNVNASDATSRILFSNPAHTSKRINMTVKLSMDQCRTWSYAKTLHQGPSAYSCLGILKDGRIACLYEAGQKNPYEKITLALFTLDWLIEDR